MAGAGNSSSSHSKMVAALGKGQSAELAQMKKLHQAITKSINVHSEN